jgi:hypothetical protein
MPLIRETSATGGDLYARIPRFPSPRLRVEIGTSAPHTWPSRATPASGSLCVPESRSPGVPESRSPGVPESRSPGVPESRSPGVPESRSPGVPESRGEDSTSRPEDRCTFVAGICFPVAGSRPTVGSPDAGVAGCSLIPLAGDGLCAGGRSRRPCPAPGLRQNPSAAQQYVWMTGSGRTCRDAPVGRDGTALDDSLRAL